ncbi:hypothetical protein BOFL111202_10385 [Bordetella flabilis]
MKRLPRPACDSSACSTAPLRLYPDTATRCSFTGLPATTLPVIPSWHRLAICSSASCNSAGSPRLANDALLDTGTTTIMAQGHFLSANPSAPGVDPPGRTAQKCCVTVCFSLHR